MPNWSSGSWSSAVASSRILHLFAKQRSIASPFQETFARNSLSRQLLSSHGVLARTFGAASDQVVPKWQGTPHPALTSLHAARRSSLEKRILKKLRRSGTLIPAVLQRYHEQDLFLAVSIEPLYADLHIHRRYARTRNHPNAFCGPLYNLFVYDTEAEAIAAQKGSREPPELCFRAVLKQLHIDPLSSMPIHAGLYAFDLTGRLHPHGFRMRLPVRPVDIEDCADLRFGYVNQIVRAVDVFVAPDSIPPPFLSISVGQRRLGERLYGRDITCPPGVRLAHGTEALMVLKLTRVSRSRADAEMNA